MNDTGVDSSKATRREMRCNGYTLVISTTRSAQQGHTTKPLNFTLGIMPG
jgi:hypothetical protein